jgi:hypothetical protein
VPDIDRLTKSTLFGVAFGDDGTGVAVGAQGTILRFDGTSWREDPRSGRVTDADLYDVALTKRGAVAVGDEATVIEDRGSGFHSITNAKHLLDHEELGPPPLYDVTSLDDGTLIVGGARSALLTGPDAVSLTVFDPPTEGTILGLDALRDPAGRVRVYASISPDARKFNGDQIVATRASLVTFDGSTWKDLGLNRKRTAYVTTDSSEFVDPPYAIALDDAGRGWAVGGFPSHTPDPEGHLRFDTTSSVYRIDAAHDASPPDTLAAPSFPATGVTFAFFAETWCGQGLCTVGLGTGTQSDLVATHIQEEINRASLAPNGPKFVMFGGNGRGAGIPEELAQQAAFLQRFSRPVFGAVGSHDLFGETQGTSVEQAAGANGQQVFLASDRWQREFAQGFPAPWGSLNGIPHISPVACAGCATPTPGFASTHYAFDYTQGSRKLVRIVVVDSSSKSYGSAVPTDQNPQERQDNWLTNVFADAKTQNDLAGVPTIVVMNQPTVIPDRTPQLNWTNGPQDATTFQSTVIANAVSAVITGGLRMATRDGYPTNENVSVPIFVLGTGGAPLGYDLPNPGAPPASKLPTDGYYHAWYSVNVNPSVRPKGALPGQVQVTVTPFPVLDSLAIHALDGRSAGAGNVLRFTALARGLNGGISDPEQSRATYYDIGFSTLPVCSPPGQGNGYCASRDALQVPYRFYSEDPAIADFVMPDVGRGFDVPLRHQGKIVHDAGGTYGLLCAFKTGSTYINAVSGFHRSRIKISVEPGFGPCIDKPVIRTVVEPRVIVKPQPQPQPVPERFFRVPPRNELVAIFPPPPAPVVAPAPPGAPGVGRKEEHEVEYETESDEGHRHKYVAHHEFVPVAKRRRASPVEAPYLMLGAIAMMAFFGAAIAAAARQRRADVAYALRSHDHGGGER